MRFVKFLAAVMLLSVWAAAQAPTTANFNTTVTATGALTPLTVSAYGATNHYLFVVPIGTPGTETTVLQGSVIGDFTDATTCATTSATTATTVSCTGNFNKIRANVTTFTGFTSMVVTVYSMLSTSAAAGVGPPPGFLTGYDSGLIVPATGAATSVTSTKTSVNSIYCNNTTGIAATITIQDGSANVYVNTFNVPANSNLVLNFFKPLTFASGVKMGQGTASAINCQVGGWQ